MIRKLQTGGLAQFFALYTPPSTSRQPVQRQSASRSNKEDNTDALEKEYYNMLMKDLRGLPNEAKFMSSRLVADIQLDALKGISDPMSIQIKMAQAISQISQMKFNQEEYNKAYNKAAANNSLNDYAITVDGKVLVQNKNGEIERVSSEEFAKLRGSGDYFPITNSNILWLRANSPQYIFNNTILQTVENGINLDKVHDMIKDRMYDIGKQTTSINHIYQKGVHAKGLELLEQMTALGPEGYYEYKKKLTTADQSAINSALEYIYKTLPANAKARLRLETKNGTDKEAYELIGNMLMSRIDTSSENEIKYMGTDEKVTGKKDSEGKSKYTPNDIELNTAAKWVIGLGTHDTAVINPGTKVATVVKTTTMPLVKANGDPLGANSTLQQASEGQFGSILDFSNVSIGMNKIDYTAFGKVLLSDGKISSVDYPCTVKDGNIVPDLSLETAKKKNKALREIRSKGINLDSIESIKQNYNTINQIYVSNGLKPAYDSKGDVLPDGWRRFGVINGTINEKYLGEDYDRAALTEIQDDTKLEEIDNILRRYDKDYERGGGWFSSNSIYQGTIWIPIKPDVNAALASEKLKAKEAMDIEALTQANNRNIKSRLTERELK